MIVNKFWPKIDMNYFESFYQIIILYSNEIIDFVITI